MAQSLLHDWNMDTFINTLKELYPVSKMSHFQNDSAFWKLWIDEVKYDLQVVPGKLGDLRKKYSAQIIAMDQLHPIAMDHLENPK